MNWEYTDIALAARAGRADELRSEAASHRRSRQLMGQEKRQRIHSLRTRLVGRLAAVAALMTPSTQPTTSHVAGEELPL